MIEFKDITKDNFEEVVHVDMADSQKGFVENAMYSLAECYVQPYWYPRCVYDGDIPVGFVFYYFVPEDKEKNPDLVFLHRIFVDKNQQRKGYGLKILDAFMDYAKEQFPTIKCVELIHYPDNVAGAALYDKAGFKLTGEKRKSAPGFFEQGSKDPDRQVELVRRRYF